MSARTTLRCTCRFTKPAHSYQISVVFSVSVNCSLWLENIHIFNRVLRIMSLSTFKDTPDWRFLILAKHEFSTWQPVTLCCRLVCPDGSQWELRAQDTAKTLIESLDQQVAHSATVPRTCVKKYQPRASESTGIEAMNMIVLKYPLRNVQPAPAIFPFLTVRTEFYSADEVAQLISSAVLNMKVHVK